MVRLARAADFDPLEAFAFHCANRRVRRGFLCGDNRLDKGLRNRHKFQQCFGHDWIVAAAGGGAD